MSSSNGRISKRTARVMGLILVLGAPLAVMAPLDSSRPDQARTSDLATSAPQAASSSEEKLEGYEAAAPTVPLPDFDSIEVRESEPASGAAPVTTIVNDPRCGPGFTSAGLTGQDAFRCYHSTLDPLPEIATPLAQAAKAAPVCMGNGVNGPRIQLIYMYVEGQPNRAAQVTPRILNDIVPRMEGTFRETSKSQGREIGMRLHMPDCRPTVDTVMIDEARGAPDDPFAMAPRIVQALRDAGYGSTDRKFHVWFDGGNGLNQDGKFVGAACGIAPAYTAVVEQGLNPTPANTSNVGWNDVMISGEAAITFRWPIPILGEAPAPPFGQRPLGECWGRGAMGAHTETHELLHLIGAVGLSAPNSNGADSHCLDDIDIMCQVGANGVQKFIRCNTPVEQLDCGGDDYFNARPQVGSYLSRAWNTANSRFLGEAVVHDAVPVEIPRP